MKKVFLIGLFSLVALAAVGFGTWKVLHVIGGKHAETRQRLIHYETWVELLSLNRDQKGQIASLELEFKKDIEKIEPELARARINLCRLLLEEEATHLSSLSSSVERVTELTGHQEMRTAAYLLTLKKILTADQQKKLFKTFMKDLCVHCRTHMTTAKIKEDLCGMCAL